MSAKPPDTIYEQSAGAKVQDYFVSDLTKSTWWPMMDQVVKSEPAAAGTELWAREPRC